MLAAILHLGNVEMEDGGGDNTKIDAAEKSLGFACELLGVDSKQLAQWLSHRRIQAWIEISSENNCTSVL